MIKFNFAGDIVNGQDKIDDAKKLLIEYSLNRLCTESIYVDHKIEELLQEGHRKSEIFVEFELGEGHIPNRYEVTTGWPRMYKLPNENEDWEE